MRRTCLAIIASRTSARLALSGERTLLAWMRPQRTWRGMATIKSWRRGPRQESGRSGRLQHRPGRVRLHRRGEEVSLPVIAAHLPQLRELGRSLDALRDHLQVEAVAETDDGAHDLRLVRMAAVGAEEGAVDLQRVHGQAVEMAERRVAGAEVVDG